MIYFRPKTARNIRKYLKKHKNLLFAWVGLILLIIMALNYHIPLKTGSKEVKSSITPNIKAPVTVLSTQPSPTLEPTPTKAELYPSQILDLTNWKITLPIGSDKNPLEIRQPQLSTYKIDPWFVPASDGGVRFRAAVNGVTTSGSNYPRSELREMTQGGSSNASWSSTKGTHIMFLDQAITAVPKIKKDVVAGQIHDQNNDVIVVRLDYPNLIVKVGDKNVATLDSHYSLGKRFTVKLEVSGGQTKIYYNGSTNPSYTLNRKYSNAYFKAGVYTQSNCQTEKNASLCNSDNFGEVVIYKLATSHQ